MSGMGTCARCSKSNNISQHQQNDSKYAEKPVWQGGRTKEDKVLHLCGRGDRVDKTVKAIKTKFTKRIVPFY